MEANMEAEYGENLLPRGEFWGGVCHIWPPYFVSPYFGSTPGHFGRKYGANMEILSLEIMGLRAMQLTLRDSE